MDQRKQLSILHEEWRTCRKCSASKGRSGDIVFGLGPANPATARFLLVYDVPAEEDVISETPMAGAAGEVLQEMLDAADIPQSSCYCTPVLGCRPTVLLPATDDQPERIADRGATKEEIMACKPRLEEIIYLVDPLLIFAFGTVSWQTLVQPKDRNGKTTLEKAIGELSLHRMPGRHYHEITYPVLPMYTMKQIEASPSAAKHGTIAVTIRNLLSGKEWVDHGKKLEQSDLGKSGKA